MRLVGIDHVQMAMPVGGEARARDYYGRLLGMREVPKPAALADRGGCWFEAPGVIVHLGVQQDFMPANKAHPAFLVSDLVGLRQRLEEADMTVKPDQAVKGVDRFYSRDPFGNRLEFIQDGQGFSQRNKS